MSESLARVLNLPLICTGEVELREPVPASQAMALAFHQFREPLYRHAVMITHSPHEAEELVQEGFLKLHQQMLGGGRVQNLRAWLFRVVHNSAIDLGRTRRDAASLSDASHERTAEKHLVDRVPSPEQICMERERTSRLAVAVVQLRPVQRHCLYLRREGLTYREIASVLAIGETTVVDHLARAIARLHQELHGQ